MPDPLRPPRLYDEKEVGKLLERATEIQREEPVRAAVSGGLSLRELQEIAAEAGIDPRHLERAALELESGDLEPSLGGRLMGSPSTLVIQATVEGEMPVASFEDLVPAIQQAGHVVGQPSQVGRTFTWHAALSFGRRTRSLLVTVSVRDGQTHVRAEEELGPVAVGVFAGGVAGIGLGMGTGVGMGIGMGVLGSPLLAAAIPLGILGMSYFGAKEIFRRFAGSRRRILVAIVDRLVREIRNAVAAGGIADGDAPPELPAG